MYLYVYALFTSTDTVGEKKKATLCSEHCCCLQTEWREQQSLVSRSTRQTTDRYNCFLASQILLGLRKCSGWGRNWALTPSASACLIRQTSEEDGWRMLPICLLCGSVLMCTLRKTGWGGACQKKGTKEEYLTMTVILADCRQNQKDAAHLCDKADFCKRNIKAVHWRDTPGRKSNKRD